MKIAWDVIKILAGLFILFLGICVANGFHPFNWELILDIKILSALGYIFIAFILLS
jgi:uncharacterized membrane protein YqaE (UPF0057 family)